MNAKFKTMLMITVLLMLSSAVLARTKLVALPERADTIIRLDNPAMTLIEEERVLTLRFSGNHAQNFGRRTLGVDHQLVQEEGLLLDQVPTDEPAPARGTRTDGADSHVRRFEEPMALGPAETVLVFSVENVVGNLGRHESPPPESLVTSSL